jgi:3-oxoacyl-[acyl-carrier protein] reductase
MQQYSGKTVLVTGSTRGVGKAITDHFLSKQATVVGFARSKAENTHKNYLHFQLDLAQPDEIVKAFQNMNKQGISIDIVINNAAILTSQYSMIMPIKAASDMVNINLLAPFIVSREAAKMMKKTKWGRIINIGSMARTLEPVGDSMYAASKAGLETLSNVMAKEFSSFNTTCNTLAISAIESDMLRQLPREKVDEIIATLPLKSYAKIEDVINIIDIFSSPKSNQITGQTLYLGGVN